MKNPHAIGFTKSWASNVFTGSRSAVLKALQDKGFDVFTGKVTKTDSKTLKSLQDTGFTGCQIEGVAMIEEQLAFVGER